jgi:hypothetical protein
MDKIRHLVAGLVLSLIACAPALAAPALNPDHPDRYVVQRGDTLWDIASSFLLQPWRWPEIWQVNPQIANPHLIYPGDELSLVYLDGRPLLQLRRGKARLSPEVRRTPLDGAIPAIPIDAIKQFLSRQYVADAGELDAAPYLVDFVDEHIVGAAGDAIYVRGLPSDYSQTSYQIVRPGKPYKDPDTGEILGYKALYIGRAELERPGDPAKLNVKRTQLETAIGDRLFPDIEEIPLTAFHPKAPDRPVEGKIIDVLGGVTEIGQYQTVVLSRGADDGLQDGDVLQVMQGGFRARDRVAGGSYRRPLEEAGILMVYRTYPRISFGLILYANKALHVLDTVRNPDL